MSARSSRGQASFATGFEVNILTVSVALNFSEIFFTDNVDHVPNATGPFSIFNDCYFGWEKLPDDKRATGCLIPRLRL